jgi:transposase-like protein
MVLDREAEHSSRWATIVSIAGKIGCTPQTLLEWIKKAEIDSGKRSGVPSDVAERVKVIFPRKSGRRVMWSEALPVRG